MIVPDFQGRGIAMAAIAQAIEVAKRDDSHRLMHTFPKVHNTPSNAICRKPSFELLGTCEFEFPKGHFMTCNDDGQGIEDSVRRLVDGTVELLARAAPLVWTVLGDETARDGYEHNERLRRLGYADLVSVLAEKQPLRAGITPTRARDLMLVLTGPQLFVQYTRDLGWSEQELADWVTDAVLEQVFAVSR